MAASTLSLDKVQKLYIAYFGRPADPVGLEFWASKVDAASGSESEVIAGFSASNESQALFGGRTTANKVNSIYRNLFDRDAEPAGLTYWTQQIDSGQVTQAQAAYTILTNAGPGDIDAINNKFAGAGAFTAALDTPAEREGYSGATPAQTARDWLASINAEQTKLDAALAQLEGVVATATGQTAQPSQPPARSDFSITSAADHEPPHDEAYAPLALTGQALVEDGWLLVLTPADTASAIRPVVTHLLIAGLMRL